MSYKYFIKSRNNKFYFGLYPNNSNTIPLAISGNYMTYDDAKDGIAQFKSLLKTDSNMFAMRRENDRYYFDLIDNQFNMTFFRTKALHHRYEVPHCISRIYKNYEAPLKYTKEKDI